MIYCEKGHFACKVTVVADGETLLERLFEGDNAEADKATYFDEITFLAQKAKGIRLNFEVTVGDRQYFNAVQLLVRNENGFASIAPVKEFNKMLKETF